MKRLALAGAGLLVAMLCLMTAWWADAQTPWSLSEVAVRGLLAAAAAPGLRYLAPAAVALVLLGGVALWPVLRTGRTGTERHDRPSGELLFLCLLVLLVVLMRWPLLAVHEQNPDESIEIAAALALQQDPLFWRSVDTGTRGPLTTAPLLLPRLFGMRIDYGSAKLVTLCMGCATIIFAYLALRSLFAGSLVRVAILPLVVMFGAMRHAGFLAYNGEHPVMVLCCFAFFLASWLLSGWERGAGADPEDGLLNHRAQGVLRWFGKHRSGPEGCSSSAGRALPLGPGPAILVFMIGVILGSVAYAKLQGAPLAVSIMLFTVMVIMVRARSWAHAATLTMLLGVGVLLPSMVNYLICLSSGVDQEFLRRFVNGQLGYATANQSILTSRVVEAWRGLLEVNRVTSGCFLTLGSAAVVLLLLAAGVQRRRRLCLLRGCGDSGEAGGHDDGTARAGILGLVLFTGSAMAAIVVLGGQFNHYYLLLFYPLGALVGALFLSLPLYVLRPGPRILAVMAFVLFCTATLFFDTSSALWQVPWRDERVVPPPRLQLGTQRHQVSEAVLRYATPGERMIIWGWMDQYYVETGLAPAIRTRTEQLFLPFGDPDFYIDSILAEMSRSHAPVLLDVVTPGSFYLTDRSVCGMQLFPPINTFVRQHYVKVETVAGVDIYLSRSRYQACFGDDGTT